MDVNNSIVFFNCVWFACTFDRRKLGPVFIQFLHIISLIKFYADYADVANVADVADYTGVLDESCDSICFFSESI